MLLHRSLFFAFVLAAVLGLSATSAQAQLACGGVLEEPLTAVEMMPELPMPLRTWNDLNRYPEDMRIGKELMIPSKALHHIFHGDFEPSKAGSVNQVRRLHGGLHTESSLRFYLAANPKLRQKVAQNSELWVRNEDGTSTFLIPLEFFQEGAGVAIRDVQTANGRLQVGVKGIFPSHWRNIDTLMGILSAFRNGHDLFNGREKPAVGDGQVYKVKGTFQGVEIVVVYRNNQIPELMSAYPAQKQIQRNKRAS